jgi:hypothetical protein
MNEDVAEPNGLAHRDCQLGCEDPVLSEQSDGVAVVGRRPPAFCRADVLRDIDASLMSYPRLPATLAANSRCARVMRGSLSK